jgi:hypothetical protein
MYHPLLFTRGETVAAMQDVFLDVERSKERKE